VHIIQNPPVLCLYYIIIIWIIKPAYNFNSCYFASLLTFLYVDYGFTYHVVLLVNLKNFREETQQELPGNSMLKC